jgi:isoleucyl-tRNA synthetase
MRKDLDLEVEQRIRLEMDVADDRVAELVDRHRELIAEEVRADEFGPVADGYREEWDVEGVAMTFAVEAVDG